MVFRNGGSYIAISNNTAEPPETNPDNWDLVSAQGSTGADGGVITIPYTFSTSTAMADPGNGVLRLNNTTQNAATALVLDLIDSRGIDFSSVLASAFGTTNPVRGHIRIHKATDTTKFLTLAVSGEALPGGFRQYTVPSSAPAAPTPFAEPRPGGGQLCPRGRSGRAGHPRHSGHSRAHRKSRRGHRAALCG